MIWALGLSPARAKNPPSERAAKELVETDEIGDGQGIPQQGSPARETEAMFRQSARETRDQKAESQESADNIEDSGK